MRNDSPGDGTDTKRVADKRRLADAPRGGTDDRQVLPGCRGTGPRDVLAAQPAQGTDATQDLLGEISDSLLIAYRLAQQDGDALTVALIGKALMHTGRRLALGMSPAEAGILCH
jgi:hypothetical protein